MEEWRKYLRALLSHLREEFPELMRDAEFYVWKVPEIAIKFGGRVSEAEYFCLYKESYEVIRSALPEAKIASPTISTHDFGLAFAKRFLSFAAANDCLPSCVQLTAYQGRADEFDQSSPFLECKLYIDSLNEFQAGLHLPEKLPVRVLAYSMAFGGTPYADGMPGAMLPLTFTAFQHRAVESCGILPSLDFSTRLSAAPRDFRGAMGVMTSGGCRKGCFFSLWYLSRLEPLLIAEGPGYLITRSEDRIAMLLYYNIPEAQWPFHYDEAQVERFYGAFADMEFSVGLKDIPWEVFRVREEWLNAEDGSAYETWLRDGWLEEPFEKGHEYCSQPRVRHLGVVRGGDDVRGVDGVGRGDGSGGREAAGRADVAGRGDGYVYRCRMRAFEVRFVAIEKV